MIPNGTEMVSCERVVELLLEYLEGGLAPMTHAAMEKHLELCPPCVEFARQYQETSSICRHALAREMPGDVHAHLLAFLRGAIDPDTSQPA